MTDMLAQAVYSDAPMEAELDSQPDAWERATRLTADQAHLPAPGERIAVVGCGTSWFTGSYPAKEYRNGPIAITAPRRVTWVFGKAPDGLPADIAATGGHSENRPVDAMTDLIRAQRVTLERARCVGLDPDRPRNLPRSVILDS